MTRSDPRHATVVVTGLFLVGLLCGALAGRAAVARVTDPYAHLDLFARVLATIQEDYVDELTGDQLIDAAIDGMIDELDSQSRWLDSEQLQTLRDEADGTTTGIGIEVRSVDHGVQVTKVLPGSPALRQGLTAGDTIVAVDGQQLAGLRLEDVREWFDGDRGELTALTVMREGWTEPRVVEATHDTMRREAVEGALLDGVIYLRLDQFQEGSATDLLARATDLARPAGGIESVAGLVLDLRDNPGGLLTEAVAVTDLFLDDGIIVSTRGRSAEALASLAEEHLASPGGFPPDLRVVVVINGMSASASEIVAGALQDTDRATIVGERSYGKGTVQQVYMHLAPDSAALKLTVGTYTTPSGQPVAPREGRVPDVVVPWPMPPPASEQLRARLAALEQVDPDERVALLTLAAGLRDPKRARPEIPWGQPLATRVADDPQIQAALAAARSETPSPNALE